MTGHRITVPGFKLSKSGKLEKLPSYKQNASAAIAQKKSKRIKPTRRQPG